MIKKLLPYEKYTLQSNLTVGSACQVVDSIIGYTPMMDIQYEPFGGFTRPDGYQGNRKGTEFEIKRVTTFGNGLRPLIKGNIVTADKTEINITVKLTGFGYFIWGILIPRWR